MGGPTTAGGASHSPLAASAGGSAAAGAATPIKLEGGDGLSKRNSKEKLHITKPLIVHTSPSHSSGAGSGGGAGGAGGAGAAGSLSGLKSMLTGVAVPDTIPEPMTPVVEDAPLSADNKHASKSS